MKCHQVQQLLPPCAEGKLAGQALEAVNQHLATCPACRLQLEQLKSDISLLRSAQPPEPGAFFVGRVMAEIRQVERAPSRSWPAWARALGGAAATLLVVGGLGAGALLGHGLAQGQTNSTTAEEVTLSADEPAFADAFVSALAGD